MVKFLSQSTIFLFLLFGAISLNAQQARSFGIINSEELYQGASILEVVPGGPAEKAGIKARDLIVQVGKKKLDRIFYSDIQEVWAANQDTATIRVKRDGKILSFKLKTADAFSFGRKCLSGNCIDGEGELKIGGTENMVYKGKFTAGVPNGLVEIFHGNGRLYYKGNLSGLKRNGLGETYLRNGDLESKGTYQNDRLIKGMIRIPWDYHTAFVHAENIRYSGNKMLLQGEVKYTYKTADGKLLAVAKFDQPQTGNCDAANVTTYEYSKDVRIEARVENGKTVGSLYDLKTGKLKGKNLLFEPCEYANLDGKILYGVFNMSEIDVPKLWVTLDVKNYQAERKYFNIHGMYLTYQTIISAIADSIDRVNAARPAASSGNNSQTVTAPASALDKCSDVQKYNAKDAYNKAVTSFNREMTIVNGYIKDYNAIKSDNKGAEAYVKKLVFDKAVKVYERAKVVIESMLKYHGDCLSYQLYDNAKGAVEDMRAAIYNSSY